MAKRKEKAKREFTKRQISQRQQAQRRQRIILGLGIFIIVVVLAMVGIGWYVDQYRPPNQTVIKVNDTEFDMGYYIKMLRYYGQGWPSQYLPALPDQVTLVIEQNELVRQGAMALGITVDDDTVDTALKSRNPPLSKDYRDVVRTELLVGRLLNEYFEAKVAKFAAQKQIMPMLLESISQATDVRARIDKGENFSKLADNLSVESFSKSKKGDLGWHTKDALTQLLSTPIPADYAFNASVGTLSQPIYDDNVTKNVGYWLIKVLERNEARQQVHVQVMLLGSAEQAKHVEARLKAGEDFATLAKELSQHEDSKANGGDLGWLDRGVLSPTFDGFAFDPKLTLNTVSPPIRDDTVQTKSGYWLIKILDEDDNREIEKSDRDILKADALNNWGTSLLNDPKNKIDHSYLTDEKKIWALGKALGS